MIDAPTTWEQAATKVANLQYATDTSDAIGELIHYFVYMKTSATPWDSHYRLVGGAAAAIRKQRAMNWDLAVYRNQLVELLASKQHDYGHDNINAFGHQGIVVRISDKIARLENLLRRADDAAGEPIHESIADTLDDIVGYCIIGVMLLEGTFDLPLAADVAPEPEPAWFPTVSIYRNASSGALEAIVDGDRYTLVSTAPWPCAMAPF